MSQPTLDREVIRQAPQPADDSSQRPAEPAPPSARPPGSLWSEREAAAFYGVSTRKFAEMRSEGLVPEPVTLGPRALRWVPDECRAAVQRLPRIKLGMPAQLLRGKIERLKREGVPA